MQDSLVTRIIDFATNDNDIRAVILEGSLACGLKADEFSDYDVNIFSNNFSHYLEDDDWLNRFGAVRLYQKEGFDFYGSVIPTRLVLFKDGNRIDFSFWHTDLLRDMVEGRKIYESYHNGFQMLVDKDGLAGRLNPPDGRGFVISKPNRDEFLQLIYDFWFEAYCVAKYLFRKDLWYAKLVENRYIKDHLYRMILWNHQAKHDWKSDPILHSEGKRFECWASHKTLSAIKQFFSGYENDATWASLFAMVEFFNCLAQQTSKLLNITYPLNVEQDMMNYIGHIRELEDRSI